MRIRTIASTLVAFAIVAAACGDDSTDTTGGSTTTLSAADLTSTPGVLTVGSDIPYPPFESFDEDGAIVGYDVDIITEIADRLGLTVEWVDTDFDTIFTQLATGAFDVVVAAASISPERATQVSFTEPYYLSQQSLTVNTAATPTIGDTTDLQQGDVVGVQTGTTGADWAAANLASIGVEVREFVAIADAYIALEAGRVTGVVNDAPSAIAEVASRPGLAVVEVIDTGEHYGIAVDPNRPALLAAIEGAFADMLADGTYQDIYEAWFDAPEGSVQYQSTPEAALGTEENPIQILFAPMVPPEDLANGGAILVSGLEATTGLAFEVAILSSYAETVRAMCAATDSVAIVPAEVFVVAEAECGYTPELKALRFGYADYWTEIVVARDSEIVSIQDLDGLQWAYPEAGSASGDLIARGMFAIAGITPGGESESGGHTEAVAEVYDGVADFATVRFSPNIDLEGNTVWDGTIAGADIPSDLVDDCAVDEDGDLTCGALRPRDARRGLRDLHPDVIQQVRILAVSDPIPNEMVVFGPALASSQRTQIVEALNAYATQDPEGFSDAFEALIWDGLEPAGEEDVAGVRALLLALGFGIEDL